MEQTTHRCINIACGRAFPRAVAYCPWCGTAQQAVAPGAPGLDKWVAPAAAVTPDLPAHAGVPAAAPSATATPAAGTPAASTPAAGRPAAGMPAAGTPPTALPPPVPPNRPAVPPKPLPPAPAPRTAAAHRAAPARKPIRLRWWLAALALLWLAWMLTKPLDARIERRMKEAIALAQECKPREAQDELIELRGTRASPAQLRQVQEGLNAAAAACKRAERRRTDWQMTETAVERLMRNNSQAQARTRLSTFTRRWGENDETRALARRIDAGRRERPLADPSRGE